MISKKFKRLEDEIYRIGMRTYMLSDRKAGFSNRPRYEMSVYFLNPRTEGTPISGQQRELVSKKADEVGLYTMFFAMNEFEEKARNMVWKEYSIENGIVVAFLPKYPFSRVKKIMREIQDDYRKSFEYFQEDEGVLGLINQARLLEKQVLCLSRKAPDCPIYEGDISESPVYRTMCNLKKYQSTATNLLPEQADDIKAMCFLMNIR
jgi:hypothetical protein